MKMPLLFKQIEIYFTTNKNVIKPNMEVYHRFQNTIYIIIPNNKIHEIFGTFGIQPV